MIQLPLERGKHLTYPDSSQQGQCRRDWGGFNKNMFNYKTQPYEHQHEALVRSHDKTNFAYFMEMGCGKSKVLLDNIVWLYEKNKIDTAIVVHQRAFTEIGKHRRYQPTFPNRFHMRYMYGIRIPTKPLPKDFQVPCRSVVSSAYCWLMWRVSQHQRCRNTWIYLHKAVRSYLQLTSPLQSRIPKPKELRRWLHLVERRHLEES